jgi:predicted SnoaL-like aldol condensation-catalyzing enzyme
MPSAAPSPDPTLDPTLDPRLEANKQTVLAFYEAGLNNKDFEAVSKLVGDRYTQHNPLIADGREGLKAFVATLTGSFPALHADVKRLFAEGDYVIAHVHGVRVPGQPGSAIVDIFRFDEGKIVEHWDVMQPIPERSANGNGMF